MNARAWCLVALRCIGLLMIVHGLAELVLLPLSFWNAATYVSGPWIGFQLFLGDSDSRAALIALAGLYFFFGGKWVARQLTRGLAVPGMCPGCGYDVRGLESARCPECGSKLR